jgi:hypothetical protein
MTYRQLIESEAEASHQTDTFQSGRYSIWPSHSSDPLHSGITNTGGRKSLSGSKRRITFQNKKISCPSRKRVAPEILDTFPVGSKGRSYSSRSPPQHSACAFLSLSSDPGNGTIFPDQEVCRPGVMKRIRNDRAHVTRHIRVATGQQEGRETSPWAPWRGWWPICIKRLAFLLVAFARESTG